MRERRGRERLGQAVSRGQFSPLGWQQDLGTGFGDILAVLRAHFGDTVDNLNCPHCCQRSRRPAFPGFRKAEWLIHC